MTDDSARVVTVFRSRLREDAGANGYYELTAKLDARARAMPGFVDAKTFTAADGERVTVVTFDNAEHQRAWGQDPEHREAQRRGREEFYSEYSISVCEERHRGLFVRG
ncbi:antibiotic biosynthesis monooxygenase [Nocardia terpenica]